MVANQPCWIQIPAFSVPRAVAFYRAVLDFHIRDNPADSGNESAVAHFSFPGGPLEHCLTGGIIPIPDHMQKGLLKNETVFMSPIYFAVANLEESIKKVRDAGGKILQERTEIGGDMGFRAEFKDTEGNFYGLYTMEPAK